MKIKSLVVALALSAATAVLAAEPATDSQALQQTDTDNDIFDLDFDENVHSPKLPGKQQKAIRDYMHGIAKDFYKKGYKVETMRSGEVVIVSVACDDIFLPNDSAMLPDAGAKLRPVAQLLKNEGWYKLVTKIHSDNTGTAAHLQSLTESRVASIYDWFDSNVGDNLPVVGYPMGSNEPIVPNDSRKNRKANRRVEFYIVPDNGLIAMAKNGKL